MAKSMEVMIPFIDAQKEHETCEIVIRLFQKRGHNSDASERILNKLLTSLQMSKTQLGVSVNEQAS